MPRLEKKHLLCLTMELLLVVYERRVVVADFEAGGV